MGKKDFTDILKNNFKNSEIKYFLKYEYNDSKSEIENLSNFFVYIDDCQNIDNPDGDTILSPDIIKAMLFAYSNKFYNQDDNKGAVEVFALDILKINLNELITIAKQIKND